MKRLRLGLLVIIIALPALSAPPLPDAAPNSSFPVKLPDVKGVVSWKTLGEVEETTVNHQLISKFSTAIVALDSQQVKLQGFMIPLDMGKKQKRFLLSANVPSCPFCMPGGPESLIEVVCKQPIAFNMEPVIVSGKFSVLKDDANGLWYRLVDAVPATAGKP